MCDYRLGFMLLTWHNFRDERLTFDRKVWKKVLPGVWKLAAIYPNDWTPKEVVNNFYLPRRR